MRNSLGGLRAKVISELGNIITGYTSSPEPPIGNPEGGSNQHYEACGDDAGEKLTVGACDGALSPDEELYCPKTKRSSSTINLLFYICIILFMPILYICFILYFDYSNDIQPNNTTNYIL